MVLHGTKGRIVRLSPGISDGPVIQQFQDTGYQEETAIGIPQQTGLQVQEEQVVQVYL